MKLVPKKKGFSLWIVTSILLGVCSTFPAQVRAATAGRWASTDHVTMTGTAKVGSKFFLDIVVSDGGSFRGSWEEHVCFNYPGAYGINITSCQRSRKANAASGRLDATSQTGQIDLTGLGSSSFRFKTTSNSKGQPQLDIELPRDWLKQGAPVLYETSLNPK